MIPILIKQGKQIKNNLLAKLENDLKNYFQKILNQIRTGGEIN
tara:strand:- start:53 stop:181 length:129 start_codon:yes stop_codon:yes gene_type:complete